MNLADYFERVPALNAAQSVATPGDLRLAINAILTLDGFFGSLHAEFRASGAITEANDDRWKAGIAKGNKNYQILRDTAYALKHGELNRRARPPRLVVRSNQVVSMPAAFEATAFQADAFQTKEMVWISALDNDYRAFEVILEVAKLAQHFLDELSHTG